MKCLFKLPNLGVYVLNSYDVVTPLDPKVKLILLRFGPPDPTVAPNEARSGNPGIVMPPVSDLTSPTADDSTIDEPAEFIAAVDPNTHGHISASTIT